MAEDPWLDGLARRMESLRSPSEPPAWAEIIGPLAQPAGFRWHHGVETLIGFRAPPECQGLAVVANGWGRGRQIPPSEQGGPIPPRERRRIRVVCLVTRMGERAGYLRIGTDIAVHEPPGQGRVLDSMLRSFGLPTAPPAETTDRVLAVLWLANLEHHAQTTTGCLTWATAAGLHPAMEVLADIGKAIPPDQITAAVRAAGKAWTWSYLAEVVAVELLPAGAREWMDDGMVSRWLTDALPGPDDVLDRVRAMLSPAVGRKVRSTLEELKVLGPPDQPSTPEEGRPRRPTPRPDE